MHEQQLTSGLLRNIAPMMATFCNTWNMHCIKWICSSPPFGSMYRINTRDKDESEHFTFSKFYAIAHYSFACMEPTRGDESCIQMDRQGAFSTDKKHADFQEQIIRHSTRQTNAMAMEDRACILRRCTARIVQVGLRPFWMEPVDTIVCNGVKLKYAPKLVPI